MWRRPAQPQIMQPLYRQLYASLKLERGPVTPAGVYAREVQGRVLYVNSTGEEKVVELAAPMTDVLSGQLRTKTLHLAPLAAELLAPDAVARP